MGEILNVRTESWIDETFSISVVQHNKNDWLPTDKSNCVSNSSQIVCY
jgi:hypothetical protein